MTRVRMTMVVGVLAATAQLATADLAERMTEIRRIAPPERELTEPVWLDPAAVVSPSSGGSQGLAPVVTAPLRSIEVAAAPVIQPILPAGNVPQAVPAPVSPAPAPVMAGPPVYAHDKSEHIPWYYSALDWVENLGMDDSCSCSADGYPCPEHIKKHHARYYPCIYPGYLPMWGYVPTRWRPFPEPGWMGPPVGPDGEILYEMPAGAPHPELLPRPPGP